MKMKFLTWLMAACLLAACSKFDVPEDEEPEKPGTEQPQEGDTDTPDGDEDYLTVAEALQAEEDTYALVVGYIVGYIPGTTLSASVFGCPKDGENTNMILADDPHETDPSRVFPVSLPTTGENLRSKLNLFDYPEYLGRLVGVEGMLTSYFRTIGIRKPLAVYWIKIEGEDDGGDPEEGGEEDTPPNKDKDEVVVPIDDNGKVVVGR